MDDILEQVVGYATWRWTIAVLVAGFQALAGHAPYQMGSARGFVRCCALGFCVDRFLDAVRATYPSLPLGAHLTLGQPQ